MNNYTDRFPFNPLSLIQMQAMKKFLDGYLLSKDMKNSRSNPTFVHKFVDEEDFSQLSRALSKTYDVENPHLLKAKEILVADLPENERDEAFKLFRAVIADPKIKASEFGLEPNQIFAARMFLKAGVKLHPWSFQHFQEVFHFYCNKMTGSKNNHYSKKISLKNQMLMENDPLQRLPAENGTILDYIFAHIYFLTPTTTVRHVTHTKDGEDRMNVEVGPSRDVARGLMKTGLAQMSRIPELNPILLALACLMRYEKGQFFFAGGNLDSLRAPYGGKFNDNALGFYNGKHSVFLSSLIDPQTSQIAPNVKGVFIQCALYMLLKAIFKDSRTMIVRNSPEEQALERAIEADKVKIAELQPSNPMEETLKKDILTILNMYATYDPIAMGAEDPQMVKHRPYLEYVLVRPLYYISCGLAHVSFVDKLTPNIWKCYLTAIEPLLQQYINKFRKEQPSKLPPVQRSKVGRLVSKIKSLWGHFLVLTVVGGILLYVGSKLSKPQVS